CTPHLRPLIYPLSLHDALPISLVPGLCVELEFPLRSRSEPSQAWELRRLPLPQIRYNPVNHSIQLVGRFGLRRSSLLGQPGGERSEEHTSELQSLRHLVCRLLL